MLINKISAYQDNNTSFKSRFDKGDRLLGTAFDIAKKQKNDVFAESVTTLLNDGRNELITFVPDIIRRNVYRGMGLLVDGKQVLYQKGRFLEVDAPERAKALYVISLMNQYANRYLKGSFKQCEPQDTLPKLNKAARRIFSKKADVVKEPTKETKKGKTEIPLTTTNRYTKPKKKRVRHRNNNNNAIPTK